MHSKQRSNKSVLVGVLKNRRDQRILLKRCWYRIPAGFLPKRKFRYVAFYQPAVFGRGGKRIEYYAKVLRRRVVKRIELLPKEPGHPQANDDYLKIEFKEVRKLPRPVKNIVPRRVSFGFTTLKKLFSARDILELYGVPPTERIVGERLRRLGWKAVPEFPVTASGKRFRLDFAITESGKRIAVECDNERAHAGKTQKRKDKAKNFRLRRAGWRVIRLKEKDIVENLDACMRRIQKAIKNIRSFGVK